MSFLVILKPLVLKKRGQTSKAIMRCITSPSSHHHIGYLHERGGGEGVRETDFKAETCAQRSI